MRVVGQEHRDFPYHGGEDPEASSAFGGRPNIRCPNCEYVGRAKAASSGGSWLVLLGLVVFGVVIWWALLLIAMGLLVWLLFKPAQLICPRCKFANPIPTNNVERL